MRQVLDTLRRMGVSQLVTLGGGDTGYSASQLYSRAGGMLRVAHVPKTIDNDLPLPGHTPTLGFETARHVGTGILRNLAEDARTTSRWYLVVTMGRLTGHLALGIGKAAAATLTVIPEEFAGPIGDARRSVRRRPGRDPEAQSQGVSLRRRGAGRGPDRS